MKSTAANTTARDEVARAEGAGEHGDHAQRAKGRVAPALVLAKAPCVVVFDECGRELGRTEDPNIVSATLVLTRAVPPAAGPAPLVWVPLEQLVEQGVWPSMRAAREAVAAGVLPASKNGRAILVRSEDVNAFLASRRLTPRPRKAEPAKGQGPAADPLEDEFAAAEREAGFRRVAR